MITFLKEVFVLSLSFPRFPRSVLMRQRAKYALRKRREVQSASVHMWDLFNKMDEIINVFLTAHDKVMIIYRRIIYIYYKRVKELLCVHRMHFSRIFLLVSYCFELKCKPKFAWGHSCLLLIMHILSYLYWLCVVMK